MTGTTIPPFIREQASLILSENPVFLDTETSGLTDQDLIAEIAIIDTDGSVLFESLVRTCKQMDEAVIRIHGITNEELASAPTWSDICDQVNAVLKDRVVVCHNAPFDEAMLSQTARSAGVPPSEPAAWMCTMRLLLPATPERERMSLATAMQISGADDSGLAGKPHRAAYDAQCCRRVLMAVAGDAAAAETKAA